MSDITLLAPQTDITAYPVRILSSYIKSKGFSSRLVLLPEPEHCEDIVRQGPAYSQTAIEQLVELCSDSRLIGISLFTSDFPDAVYLTQCLKEKLNIPIIWGGKHPSAKPEQALLYADMVCIGEGEEALAELLGKIASGEDYHKTKNIWFKRDGEIIKNGVRPLIEELDLIPFADYSYDEHYVLQKDIDRITQLTPQIMVKYLPLIKPRGLVPYETLLSRGCPYGCSYCFSFRKMYEGQKYLRFRSVANMMEELEIIKRKFDYVQIIWFVDDNIFSLPIKTIEEFCRLYKERIGLPMSFTGHPRNIDEEKLSYFVDAGLELLHVGVQTGSKRTQKLYKRPVSNEVILKAVHAIDRFKGSFLAGYDIITDNPWETSEDLRETIKLMLKFPRPCWVKVFSLMLFPGTELREKALQEGLFSEGDIKAGYSRDFGSFYCTEPRYLNYVIRLFNTSMPNFMIRFLASKSMVFLFDRPFVNKTLFKMAVFLDRIVKRLRIKEE